MDIALWIVTALLAVVFLAAGLTKLTNPKDALLSKGMGFVEDYSAGQVKAIGAVEVIGAIGLIGPAFVDSISWLVPTAAVGFVIVMGLATAVHVRRKEPIVPTVVLAVVAALVAIGRFWVAPF